jgi:hypothetical protein
VLASGVAGRSPSDRLGPDGVTKLLVARLVVWFICVRLVSAAPASVKGPHGVGVDQVRHGERDGVGKTERPVAGPQRRRVVGDGCCHWDGLAAIDEVSRGRERDTSGPRRANEDLRAGRRGDDQLTVAQLSERGGRSSVMGVIGGERGDRDARVEHD